MRKFVALACLGLLTAGCGDPFKEEAVYKGQPTSYWVERLKAKKAPIRREAAQALGELGPSEVDMTLDPLIEALKDKDTSVRFFALRSIGKLGPKARPATNKVAKLMMDKNTAVAKEAMAVHRQLEMYRPSSLNNY
jgi:HEAT repeat protein